MHQRYEDSSGSVIPLSNREPVLSIESMEKSYAKCDAGVGVKEIHSKFASGEEIVFHLAGRSAGWLLLLLRLMFQFSHEKGVGNFPTG